MFLPISLFGMCHSDLSGDKSSVENIEQLRQFAKFDMRKSVIVTDLHDVALDRLSGDFSRAKEVIKDGRFGRFLCGLSIFGPRYIAHKLFGWPAHPSIEYYACNTQQSLDQQFSVVRLISPFVFNNTMHQFYKNCGRLVFVCSNIGPFSYEFMRRGEPEKFKVFAACQCATQEDGYMQKDNPKFFELLVDKIVAQLGYKPEAILMIDDSQKNLATGKAVIERCGIKTYCYHFKSAQEFVDQYKQSCRSY